VRRVNDESTDTGGTRKSRLARLLTLPRAAAGVAGVAVITGLVGYFLPRILNSATASATTPLYSRVLDDSEPPLLLLIPPARTVGSAPSGPTCEAFLSWARSAGGVDAGTTRFSLVIQGNTDAALYIAGVRAHLVSTAAPDSGALVECPTQGEVKPHKIVIDLESAARGRYVTNASGSPFGVTVGKGESEVFDVTASTQRHTFSWLLEVKAIIAGQTRVLLISDHGRPFQTTPLGPLKSTYQWSAEGEWREIIGHRPTSRTLRAGAELRGAHP
jgi:hypothetical protein